MSLRLSTIGIIIATVACSKLRTVDTRFSPDADVVPQDSMAITESAIPSRPSVPDDVRLAHSEEWRKFNEAASSFKVSDGISREEAEFLGEAYFVWQLGGCGYAGPAKESKREWRMLPRVGLRGEYDSSFIRVDKRTGAVRYDSEKPIAARDLIEIERRRLQKELKAYLPKPVEEPPSRRSTAPLP